MRIATITNWAYGITVGLTLASGSAMLMASSADRVERQAVQQRQVFDTLSDEVENDAWALSDLARLYVIKPSPETLTQYQQLQQTDKSIEQRLGGLKDNGASREELALLQDGLRIADELQDEQQAALAHVARGDAPAAIAVLYGTAYETELERMQTQIDRFRQMLEHRAAVAIDQATERSRIWRTLSEIMVGLTALMFLFVLGFILKRRVLYPVVRLSDVVQLAAQKQMRSERMRTELITNVSHDIKTPLTSIINYVDLLQKPHSPENAQTYLEVLSRQSNRMKRLIDDLIELSKASTGNITVNLTTMDAVETVNQALGEFTDKLEAAHLMPVFRAPKEPLYIHADGRLAWRAMSNLLSNAAKYAQPDTRLYVDMVAVDGKVCISFKNISRDSLNISADELMERFVRGEASRSQEGSGLGLNIAKSMMELQHGALELLVDGDLFKATLIFPQEV